VTARFCLACGGRLATRVDEGQRRRDCRRCGWTYYGNPVPATAAVIVERGRLLLGRRARPPYVGAWDVPGGFIEATELPLAGLHREMREELGVGVARATLIGFANDRYGPRGVTVLTAVYRVHPTSRRVRAADDVAELRWFPRAKIPYREIAFPSVVGVVRRYLEDVGRTKRGGRARR
jgi:8-oxo-dGTP diphosphatase